VTDPAPIRSPRLELPALTVPHYDRLLAGDHAAVGLELHATLGDDWLRDAAWLIGMRRQQLREHPEHQPWLIRPVIRREPGQPAEAIGYVNFHAGPSEDGMVEIGYTILPRWRRRGYATEAARAALGWALGDARVRTLRASVAPDNEASRRLVTSLGFLQVGEQMDPDDGLELVYEISGEAFLARIAGEG
jgi:ribosomal-protein-alanine N-acetyltransferase